MGRHGGTRPGSGRKKGVPDKRTQLFQADIVASGETPLDYMLRVLRDPTTDKDRRDRMAGMVAPYVHPKLASIQNTHTGDGNQPIRHVHSVEITIIDPQGGGSQSLRPPAAAKKV